MALRDTLTAIEYEGLPNVPEGFEARYARWGSGADSDSDEAVLDLSTIFRHHLEALVEAMRTLGPHDLDEPSDPPGAFGEDGIFSFETIGEMILSVSGLIHLLAGEASVVRLALGMPAASDPFDELLNGSNLRNNPA
jgi:hypothetical protein